MQLKLAILSTILLVLAFSNAWHTEAIVVPVEKLEEDLFVGADEDGDVEGGVEGDVDSRRELVESQDLEHTIGVDDSKMEESEAVLIPAGWRRFKSRISRGLRRLGNIYRRVPIPILVRIPL